MDKKRILWGEDMYCKHPEEQCVNMTFYGGKIYCDNQDGFCHLHDQFPPYTNADKIRDMDNDELADMLFEIDSRDGYSNLDDWHEWLKQPVKEE